MAASISIEEESGVFARHVHSHNGYYAGDFAGPQHLAPAAWHAPVPAFDPSPDERRGADPHLAMAGAA
jgi:hypothetical protein